jgi:hypothetical protein
VGPQSPKEVAEGYLTALARLDFAAASRFVADEGRSNFDFLQKLYADLGPEERKKFQVVDWKVTNETTNGETATVDFVFDQVKRGQLSLQRTHGVWKVDHRQTF